MDDIFETIENTYKVLGLEKCGLQLSNELYLPNIKRGNKNVLLVGGTGVGKTASFTITNILNDLGSYVVVDPFGEAYNLTHKYLEDKGYKVYKLSDGYNFFTGIASMNDVDALADIFIKKLTYNNDVYWDENAKLLFKSFLFYAITVEEMEKRIDKLNELLSISEKSVIDSLIETFPMEHPARVCYRSLKDVGEKTYYSVLSTLQTNLSFMSLDPVKSIIKNDVVDINKFLGDQKVALFVDKIFEDEGIKKYSTFVLDYFVYYLTSRYGENKRFNTYFILDEIDSLEEFKSLPTKMVESARFSNYFILITRSLEKLRNIYGVNYDKMLDCCDTQIYYGSNSVRNRAYFSKLLDIDRKVIDELDRDEMLIYTNSLKPIKARKSYYYLNKEWENI